MEYTFLEQSAAFFFSILLGVGLWFLYEPLKLLRVGLPAKKFQVIFLDIFFMICCAFATFLFALAFLNGSVRFYMILGEIIGFSVFYFTAGRFAERFLLWILKYMRKGFGVICKLFKKIVKKLLKILSKLLYNIGEKIHKFGGFFKKKKTEHSKSLKKEKEYERQSKKFRRKSKSVQKHDSGSKASKV